MNQVFTEQTGYTRFNYQITSHTRDRLVKKLDGPLDWVFESGRRVDSW